MVLLRWVEDVSTALSSTTDSAPAPNGSVTNAHEIQGDVLPQSDSQIDRKYELVKIDTFHSYVRPTWRPRLSDFCIGLTGITQVGLPSLASITFHSMLRWTII